MKKNKPREQSNVKPLRVLHIVGAMNRGGTETMLMNIYRRIDHTQVQFDFISYSQQDAHYDDEIKQLGGSVFKLSRTNSMKEMYDVIKKHGKYEVVHAHTLFHCGLSTLVALLAGVKTRISHAHTTQDNMSSLVRKCYIKLMRIMIILFSTHLLACSDGAGRYLFGNRNLTKQKYFYFPNAIDYQQFLTTSQTEVKKFKLEEGLGNHLVLGHIGTFTKAKNHLFLLEVMKRLKNVYPSKLILVGDGELRPQMEQKVTKTEMKKDVRFLGIRKDIPILLHSLDVFVFPSIYEGLGLVLLEAQACGIPCIVSEAIQPEADLGLGLIKKIPLEKGPDVWAKHIINMTLRKERNTEKITFCFEKNGFAIEKGICNLMHMYQINRGGANEKNIDRVL